MPELNGKQKRHLRSLGQTLKTTVSIGKNGFSPAVVEDLRVRLEHCELIKVHMPAGSAAQRKELSEQVARELKLAFTDVVGRSLLIYRPNKKLDDAKRIDLDLA